jgi:hypothetical protein
MQKNKHFLPAWDGTNGGFGQLPLAELQSCATGACPQQPLMKLWAKETNRDIMTARAA